MRIDLQTGGAIWAFPLRPITQGWPGAGNNDATIVTVNTAASVNNFGGYTTIIDPLQHDVTGLTVTLFSTFVGGTFNVVLAVGAAGVESDRFSLWWTDNGAKAPMTYSWLLDDSGASQPAAFLKLKRVSAKARQTVDSTVQPIKLIISLWEAWN